MTLSSRAVPETGVVEELRYSLHDQGDDAIDTRYSIFEGDEIVLLFNLPLAGHLRARDVVDAFNRADALEAKDRELAEALADKDGAYSERNQCVALIARFALSYGCRVGIAKTAIEGWDEAWHGCVYIDLPTGQVSWHYHDSEAHLFDFLPPYLGAWDGHTTLEKYERVSATFPIRPTETERERDEAIAAVSLSPAPTSGSGERLLRQLRALAIALHEKHYPDDGTGWQPLEDAEGILSQIDNMTTGLVRAEPVKSNCVRETFAYYLAEAENGLCKIPRRVADDLLQSYIAIEATLADLAQPASNWQPIETAPKDGTEILLYGHGVLRNGGVYAKGRHVGWSQTARDGSIYWATRDPQVFCDATHWQPLPSTALENQKRGLADATNNPVPLTLSGSDAEGRS